MSNFVISILHFIFIFSSNDIGIFLNQTNITDEVYILFNLTFWLVLGVFLILFIVLLNLFLGHCLGRC
ncbi:hypothetical protein [Spiroplasma endosymbiont of Andrena trimmerana]|uniref:hypothetical protein n=1 Tax=Spiroplasma endosymbiont of Andrena trimmerana TaxID=3066316 RepID=UPI0030D5FFD1